MRLHDTSRNHRYQCVLLGVFLLCLCNPVVSAQVPDWEPVPFPWDGDVFALLTTTGNLLMAGGDAGISLSDDGGETWNPIIFPNWQPTVWSLMEYRGAIYAGTDRGLLVSFDGGLQWFETGLFDAGGIDVWSISHLGDTLYAGTNLGVWRSNDGGAFWDATELTNADGLNVWSLAAQDGILYAGTDLGLFLYDNVGFGWLPTTLTDDRGFAVQSLFLPDRRLFAGTDQGIFLSLDSGLTWTPVGPKDRSIWRIVELDGILYAGTDDGIHQTPDVQEPWSLSGLSQTTVWASTVYHGYLYAGTDTGISRLSLLPVLPTPSISIIEPLADTVFPADIQEVMLIVATENHAGPWLAEVTTGDGTAFVRVIRDGNILPITGLKPNALYTVHVRLTLDDGTPIERQISDSTTFSTAQANQPPRFGIVIDPPPEIRVDTPLSLRLPADDPDGDELHYTVQPARFAQFLDAATGSFVWAPTANDIGPQTLTFHVEDAQGASDTYSFTIEVLPIPTISILEPSDGQVFPGGTQEIPLVVSITDFEHAWVAHVESPVISAPVMQVVRNNDQLMLRGLQDGATYFVSVALVDLDGNELERQERDDIAFSVGQANRAPQFDPLVDVPDQIIVNELVSLQLNAVDPDDNRLQYSVLPDEFADMMSPDTGSFVWRPTPDDVGTYALTFRVEDSDGAFDTLSITLKVIPIPSIEIVQPTDEQVFPGGTQEIAVLVSLSGHSGPWLIEVIDLAEGLVFDQIVHDSNGINLTGVEDERTYVLNALLVGGNGQPLEQQNSASITVHVAVSNRAPTFTPVADIPESVRVGERVSFRLEASDLDGDPLLFSVNPSRFSPFLNAETGLFSWIPSLDDIGTQNFTFRVEDGQGASDTLSAVLDVNPLPTIAIVAPEMDTVFPGGTSDIEVRVSIADHPEVWLAQLEIPGAGIISELVLVDESIVPVYDLADDTTYAVHALLLDENGDVYEDLPDATATVFFSIGMSNRAPRFEPLADTSFDSVVDEPVVLQLDASDADDDDLRYSILPSQFAAFLDEDTGWFDWVPGEADIGEHSLIFRVEDSEGLFDTVPVTLTVSPVPSVLITEPQNNQVFPGGTRQVELRVAILDHTNGWLAQVEVPGAGVVLENEVATGSVTQLTGLVDDTTYIVTVLLMDEDGNILEYQETDDVRFSVEQTNRAPFLNSIVGVSSPVEVGDRVSFKLTATDADGDSITFSVSPTTYASSLNAQTGSFGWTPGISHVGTNTLTFRARDSHGTLSNGRTVTIRVEPNDTTAPDGSITLASDGVTADGKRYVGARQITVSLTAQDDRSSTSQIRIAMRNSGGSWSSEETFKASRSWQLTSGEGEKEVEVRFEDAAGNTSVESLTLWLDTEAPELSHSEVNSVVLGDDVVLELEAEDLSPIQARLYYRPGGDLEYREVKMEGDSVLTADIRTDLLKHGASYYLEAEDALGHLSIYPETGQDGPVGIEVAGTFESISFPKDTWNLLSVPLLLSETLPNLLDRAVGTGAWVAESWNGTENVRQEPSIGFGESVWVITQESLQMQMEGNTVVPSGSQELTVTKGWNLVANPFTFPVAFGNVFVEVGNEDVPLDTPAASTKVRPKFWRWRDTTANDVTDGDYETVTDLAEEWLPWEGYWMFADADALLRVMPFSELASAAPAQPADQLIWQATLVAQNSLGRNRVALAIDDGASHGYDRLDEEQPPMPQSGGISLIQDDMAYQRIALSAQGDSWVWEASLRASNTVQLSISNASLDGYRLYLEDLTEGVRHELKPGLPYPFDPGDHSLRFRLTRESLGRDVLGAIPTETHLLPNYPNPFNPETWIPFALANESHVQVRVYDLAGRLVRDFNLGHTQPGRYTDPSRAVYWDGRNRLGEIVSSGVYLIELRTEAQKEIRRVLLRK